jgi:hypothetical protein
MKRVAAAVVVLAVLCVAPAAQAKSNTETAQSAQTSATLSYDYKESRLGASDFQNLKVTIDRSGMRLVDEPIGENCAQCWPAGGASKDAPSIKVRDVDADGEPEVIYDLYTGGANCCYTSIIWRYVEESNGFLMTVLNPGGSFGYTLRDLNKDGAPEFVSQDFRFAYKYGANIETPRPLRIYNWDKGRLVNATLAYPQRAAREAASLYKVYLKIRKQKETNVRGILAAYLADEYSAGRGKIGWRRVIAAYRRGDVDKLRTFDTGPYGRAYLRGVRAFLKKLGYLTRA